MDWNRFPILQESRLTCRYLTCKLKMRLTGSLVPLASLREPLKKIIVFDPQ